MRTLGPEGKWIVKSHINWREERVPARMLVPKGMDCEILHRLERGTNASENVGSRRVADCEIPHRLEKRLPTRHVLKS